MEKMWGKVDSNLKRLDRNIQRQIRSYNYSKLPKHITGDNLVDEELEEMRRKEEEKKRAFLYRNKRQDTGCRRQNFRGTDRNETYHNKHENKDWNQPNKVDKLMPEWKKAEEQPTTGKPKEKEEFATRVFEIPALPQAPIDDNWDSDAPKEEHDQVKTVNSMATIEEKEAEKTELEAFIQMEEVGVNIEITETEKSAECNSVSKVPSTSTGITVNNCQEGDSDSFKSPDGESESEIKIDWEKEDKLKESEKKFDVKVQNYILYPESGRKCIVC
ncbi:uncharacterized protein LOC128878949 isoform X7 [Hylaeus volcanicus]|uniref:uncharacterized protein LOC128878949 isoform X7 n=1 Tax=Hylaeus volcanicus TaxID=313075 RepID=UPI0023B80355|nr:uncharacterized protein LOC128878949 isoform X7 [Hylaeus volcanicus]